VTQNFFEHLYDRFNAATWKPCWTMHLDVMWANGMEGGMFTDTTVSAITGRGNGR